MSVISGQAIGSANTASYHVSRSLLLGKDKETCMLCDLLPAHGEDALVRKTPLILAATAASGQKLLHRQEEPE